MAHGLPVLAHKSGGHLETIQEGINGMFFDDLSLEALIQKIKEFDHNVRTGIYDKNAIKEGTTKYSKDRFKKELEAFVTEKWDKFQSDRARTS